MHTACHEEGIAAGPTGNLWFAEETSDKIGRINPATATPAIPGIIEFPGPVGVPIALAVGADGNLWYTDSTVGVLFVAPPSITAISPPRGPATAFTGVTITGTGFAPGATVTFGGTPVPVLINTPTSITATTPNTLGPGTVDVVITNPGGLSSRIAFTFGTPNPLPNPQPTTTPGSAPNPLPAARPQGSPNGSPNPLPNPRP